MATIKIFDLRLAGSEELITEKLSHLELEAVTGGSSPGSNPPWDGWFKDRPPITW